MARATRSSTKRNNSSQKTAAKRNTKRSRTDYASMPVEHESHGKVPPHVLEVHQKGFVGMEVGRGRDCVVSERRKGWSGLGVC